VAQPDTPRTDTPRTRILFVCTGNICRSPSAEAVLRQLAEQAGLADRLEIDSAGLGDWHVGEAPDPRARDAVAARGYRMDGQVARQVTPEDFARYDLVLAMDSGHWKELKRLCPPDRRQRLHQFLEFAPEVRRQDVPDPYYGDARGFELMMDLVEAGARGLLAQLAERVRAS
jgi:protein-tyrosine phosphatase